MVHDLIWTVLYGKVTVGTAITVQNPTLRRKCTGLYRVHTWSMYAQPSGQFHTITRVTGAVRSKGSGCLQEHRLRTYGMYVHASGQFHTNTQLPESQVLHAQKAVGACKSTDCERVLNQCSSAISFCLFTTAKDRINRVGQNRKYAPYMTVYL
jgi:hypothetical protein